VGTHPANHRIIERLGGAGSDVIGDFLEDPGAERGDKQSREQEYSDSAGESIGLVG
jgi:hypothetical protein